MQTLKVSETFRVSHEPLWAACGTACRLSRSHRGRRCWQGYITITIFSNHPTPIPPVQGVDKIESFFMIDLSRATVNPTLLTRHDKLAGRNLTAESGWGEILKLNVERLGILLINLGGKSLSRRQGSPLPDFGQILQILFIG